jgi:hypothetical protein
MSPRALTCLVISLFSMAALAPAALLADPPSTPQGPAQSKHQMMKDCMRKQEASEAGRSKEDMKQACRDVTKTEKDNAQSASHVNSPHN